MSSDLKNTVPEDRIKMYAIFALESVKKMNGIRGKLGTQAGHAYLHCFWDAEKRFPALAQKYRETSHAYKITLYVDTEEQLRKIEAAYRGICGVSLVTDAGFTVFKEPTTTCLGLGPLPDSLKGEDLANLKTLT